MAIGHIIEKMLDHIIFQIFILTGEVFVLFATDIYVVTLPYSYPANNILDYIKLFWFCIFLFEFLMSSLFEHHYAFTFNFVVDIVDLISLSTDIDTIWNRVLGQFDYYNYQNNPDLLNLLSKSEFFSTAGISIGQVQMRYFSILGLVGYLKATRIAKVIEMTNKINRNVFKTKKVKKFKLKFNLNNQLLILCRRKQVSNAQEQRMTLKYMIMIDQANSPLEIDHPFEFETYYKGNQVHLNTDNYECGLYQINNQKSVDDASNKSSRVFDSMFQDEGEESLTKRLSDSFYEKDFNSLINGVRLKKHRRQMKSKTEISLSGIIVNNNQSHSTPKKWNSFCKKSLEIDTSNLVSCNKLKFYEEPSPPKRPRRIVMFNAKSNNQSSCNKSNSDVMNSDEEDEFKNRLDKMTHYRSSVNRIMTQSQKGDSQYFDSQESNNDLSKHSSESNKRDKLTKAMTLSEELVSMKTVNHELVNQIAERLLLETQLQKRMTNNVVAMVLLIIISIEITFFTYVQDIIYNPIHNKIESCVNTTLNIIYEANRYLEIEGNNTENPYINSLNSSISICFPEFVNINQADDADISVSYFNLAPIKELIKLKESYSVLSYLPEVFASQKYQDYFSSFSINVDFVYRHLPRTDNMLLEYLIDITYSSKMEHLFNIIRTLFISIMLYLLVVRLFSDMSSLVIKPTTETIDKFNTFFSRKSLGILLLKKMHHHQDKQLALVSHYIDVRLNKRLLRVLGNPFFDFSSGSFQKEGISFRGTGMYIYVNALTKCDFESVYLINQVLTIVHSHCFGYVGEIFEPNLVIWKANSNDFENKHFEYIRDESTWHSNDQAIKSPSIRLEPTFNSTLACLCILDLNFLLMTRYSRLLDQLKEKCINMNFLLFEDEFFFGYQINEVSIKQLIISNTLIQIQKYAVSQPINYYSCRD